jgi:hypothetical protein
MATPEMGNEPIVEMVIVGKPVHEHDGWTVAGSFPCMDAVGPSGHEAIREPVRLGR